jgi:uncharacterized protein
MNQPDKLLFLVLLLTERCNLTCGYCYRAAAEKGRDLDEKHLLQALALADHGAPCHIQLSGGEPTLTPESIRLVGRRSRDFQRPPRLAIQTNATRLEPDLLEDFREYDFQVGVSLDGPPQLQERLRGGGNETLAGLQRLDEAAIEFRVTTVISHENATQLDRLLLFLAAFRHCRGMALDLLVPRGRAAANPEISPPTAAELVIGLEKLAAALRLVNHSRTQPLQLREIGLLRRGRKRPAAPFCPALSCRSLAVAPGGRIYPCAQLVGVEDFALGSLTQPQPPNPDESPLAAFRLKDTGSCAGCRLRGRCPGDCPSRLAVNPAAGNRNLACTLWQTLDRLFPAGETDAA